MNQPEHPATCRTDAPAASGGATEAAGSARILVVDDEPTIRSVITQVLTMDGFDVTQAANAEAALELYRSWPFPLVISDVVMGAMSGLDLLREIRTIDPEAIVVIMTSQASLDNATAALREGAYDFLVKPFDDLIMVSALAKRALDKAEMRSRNQLLVDQLRAYSHELERLNARLKEIADRDGLTGLHNHRYFREALSDAIAKANRVKLELALILIDVDHFKLYNDTHGHRSGDELLKELADLLADAAGPDAICARYGGEEFAIILPGANRKAAVARAESIRKRLAEQTEGDGSTAARQQVTVSIGVSAYPADGRDDKTLIDRSDVNLYLAKQAGRNQTKS